MSKIICDLCGTSYEDVMDQCPICGTAKSDASAAADSTDTSADSYSYVRGGRFSQSNVSKRTSGSRAPKAEKAAAARAEKPAQKEGSSNRGLVIVVVVLLLAIVFACAYIAIRIIDMSNAGLGHNPGTDNSGASSSSQQKIPCTGLTLLTQPQVEFTAANQSVLLSYKLEPANTTDQVSFFSSDDHVARVDEKGNVTPVANGQAIITIVCGDQQTTCTVVCNIGITPPTESQPSTPPSTGPVEPEVVEFMLNRGGFTLSGYGSSHDLTNGSVDNRWNPGYKYVGPEDKSEITWSSDNPDVATVENGVVTAVGNGNTVIRAEYKGVKVTCQVICTNVEVPIETNYELNKTDVTIAVGETFRLQLLDKTTGQRVTEGLTYSVWHETHVSVDEEGEITGLQKTNYYTEVYVEYEGVKYKCTVRITPAEETDETEETN